MSEAVGRRQPQFAVTTSSTRWEVAMEDEDPWWWLITELDENRSRTIGRYELFSEAACAATEAAQDAIAAEAPGPVPERPEDVRWVCHWLLEAGGAGGLIKIGRTEFVHVETPYEADEVTVYNRWNDVLDAVTTLTSDELGSDD